MKRRERFRILNNREVLMEFFMPGAFRFKCLRTIHAFYLFINCQIMLRRVGSTLQEYLPRLPASLLVFRTLLCLFLAT